MKHSQKAAPTSTASISLETKSQVTHPPTHPPTHLYSFECLTHPPTHPPAYPSSLYTADGMGALKKALKKLPHLTHLHLEENELGNRGAKILAKGLKGCPRLKHLKLSQNEIKRTGALAVIHALVEEGGGGGGGGGREAHIIQKTRLELDSNEISEGGVKVGRESSPTHPPTHPPIYLPTYQPRLALFELL